VTNIIKGPFTKQPPASQPVPRHLTQAELIEATVEAYRLIAALSVDLGALANSFVRHSEGINALKRSLEEPKK
jgi:hypothetical protein